jgi:hypothetical protein
MADRKDCAFYADCCYLNDIGMCPYWCLKYRHRDEVRVTRCKDCESYGNVNGYTGTKFGFRFCKKTGIATREDDYCSLGEMKK